MPKYNLDGNVLIFTDFHLGFTNKDENFSENSKAVFLNTCYKVIETIEKVSQKIKINQILFLGDFFDARNKAPFDIITSSIKIVHRLANICPIYMLVGNHDEYLKNSTKHTSLEIFENISNVIIISEPTEVSLNGNKSLLVPWCDSDYEFLRDFRSDYDFIFGHFDVPYQFYTNEKNKINKYFEDNKTSIIQEKNKIYIQNFESDDLLNDGTTKIIIKDIKYTFAELFNRCKENGTIFTGHVHNPSVINVKNKKLIIVGSTHHMDMSNVDDETGFLIMNSSNQHKRIPLNNLPKFIKLDMNEILNDDFDTSILSNNIIKKCYQSKLTQDDEYAIAKKIEQCNPLIVLKRPIKNIQSDGITGVTSLNYEKINSIKTIRSKSNLELIKEYVYDTLSNELFVGTYTNKDEVYELLHNIYTELISEGDDK